MSSRVDALREIEREMSVLLRRVRRVIGERARAVHPELQPSSYLMLGYIHDHGPMRASAMCEVFDIDKGAVSRQVQSLLDLDLVEREPDPDDGRATLISVSREGARRWVAVAEYRRTWLNERLGDWEGDELLDFAHTLGRYNRTLGGSPEDGQSE